MELDGKSFLTSVGTLDSTVWIHDEKGEHQISSEGNSYWGTFSADEKKLFFLKQTGQSEQAELWSMELDSGQSERALPGYPVELAYESSNYAIAKDGETVVIAKKDERGTPHLWVASTNHRTSPRELESTGSEDAPFFLPNGDVVYRAVENGKNYLYSRKLDGSGRRKLREEPIQDVEAISPDGRWTAFVQKNEEDKDVPYESVAYPVAGGKPIVICRSLCLLNWSNDGKYMMLLFEGGTRDATADPSADASAQVVPVRKESGLPELPPGGFRGPQDVNAKYRLRPIMADSLIGPSKYAYTRLTTRRNIFRVPIPE